LQNNQNDEILSDEVRFFITREIVQIKENSTLWKIVIKVTVIAAIFVICATNLYLWGGLFLTTAAAATYIYTERAIQQSADLKAVQILGGQARKTAIKALSQIKEQNLRRRQNSKVANLYITPSGNNVLDFIHPLLTARIERLTTCERSS